MLNTIKTAKINKKAQKGGKDYEQKGVKTRSSFYSCIGGRCGRCIKKNKRDEQRKATKDIQERAQKEFRNTERGKYTKNSKGIYYSNGNYEAFARPEKPEGVDDKSLIL